MIWLAAFALLIAAATAWYLARPLARTVVTDDRERRHQLQQLRDRLLVQLDELDVEEGDRNIDATVLTDERGRLEAELAAVLRELEMPKEKKKKEKAKAESRRGWAVALALFGVVLPLSAAGLYALNQRSIMAYLSNPQAPADASMPPMVMEMVARLEKRLSEQPDDAAGWFRLGRAYAVLGRAEAANSAYARAYKLTPDDPRVVAEYAAFLYNGDPQNTVGQVFGLFSHLLKLDPENRDAMWFLGFAAYQKADYKKALGYWERLLKALPADSQEAEHLRMIVAKTRGEIVKK
ncbi:MAG: tetratricopeptide repeat protein [Gammaproteobacteria bacterium]|nr:tetratricopeptide repeat protein [Gammaproteobacteria bacterium]